MHAAQLCGLPAGITFRKLRALPVCEQQEAAPTCPHPCEALASGVCPSASRARHGRASWKLSPGVRAADLCVANTTRHVPAPLQVVGTHGKCRELSYAQPRAQNKGCFSAAYLLTTFLHAPHRAQGGRCNKAGRGLIWQLPPFFKSPIEKFSGQRVIY